MAVTSVFSPRRFTLATAAQLIHQLRPEQVIVPASGQFALVAAAQQAGVPPHQITAADTRLLPMLYGALAANIPFSIQPRPAWKWLEPFLDTPEGQYAAAALAQAILEFEIKQPSLFRDERLREFHERADIYIERVKQQAARIKLTAEGITFVPGVDALSLIASVEPSENIVTLLAFPLLTPAQKKVEDLLRTVFDWEGQEPAEEYNLEQAAVEADKTRAIVVSETLVDRPTDPADILGAPWRSIAADKPVNGKSAKIQWVTTNRDDMGKALKRADVKPPIEGKYKLFTEGVITPASDFRIVPESKELVSYYRDLLVHRLAMVNTERYKVLLLDGKLLGCVGAHLQNLRASGVLNGVVKLTFCFTPEHPDYPRLHKLALLALTSSWAWRDEVSDIEPLPRAIQTTMLTPYPEVKTSRGIFELKDRHEQRDGTFKLTYYADLVDRTPQETIEEWLRRWGKK